MQIPWVLKAIAFRALLALPRQVHEFLTGKVTRRSGSRSLTSPAGDPSRYVAESNRHAAVLRRHIDPGRETLVELGAGKDLLSAFLLAVQGFERQVCIDRETLVRKRYLNRIRSQLPREALSVEAFSDAFHAELDRIGIRYRAPPTWPRRVSRQLSPPIHWNMSRKASCAHCCGSATASSGFEVSAASGSTTRTTMAIPIRQSRHTTSCDSRARPGGSSRRPTTTRTGSGTAISSNFFETLGSRSSVRRRSDLPIGSKRWLG
jgi:hypothetical protein